MVRKIEFTKSHSLNEKEYKKGEKIKVYPPLFKELVEDLKVAKEIKKGVDNASS